jgi:hypothetical protein
MSYVLCLSVCHTSFSRLLLLAYSSCFSPLRQLECFWRIFLLHHYPSGARLLHISTFLLVLPFLYHEVNYEKFIYLTEPLTCYFVLPTTISNNLPLMKMYSYVTFCSFSSYFTL